MLLNAEHKLNPEFVKKLQGYSILYLLTQRRNLVEEANPKLYDAESKQISLSALSLWLKQSGFSGTIKVSTAFDHENSFNPGEFYAQEIKTDKSEVNTLASSPESALVQYNYLINYLLKSFDLPGNDLVIDYASF